MSILNYIEKMKEMYEGPRITAQGPRIELAGGGWLWKLLYKGKPGLQHGAHYNRLMKQYRSQGMDLLKAGDKAMVEASEITRNKKIKIVQDQMAKTNYSDDTFVDLIDEYYRLTDYEMYKDIKRWDKTRPALADKTRAIVFPDWAEARYGEDYHTVLERGQTREIQQSIDPNIKEPLSPADQMVSDIDDMNKANLDELLEGRKKNAYGGRIGFDSGGKADQLLKVYLEEGANSPIKREVKKAILKNPLFKKFTGKDKLEELATFSSDKKGWTERNLISNFTTYRDHMNKLPNKGEGYISAPKLADKLGIPESVFYKTMSKEIAKHPQYNLNEIQKVLGEPQIVIGERGTGNKFYFYKDPGKKETKALQKFFERPILGKDTVKGLNAFFNDTELMKMLDDRIFPDIEDAQRVLKAAKLPASEHNAATAMLRLAEVLQGKKFKNEINIKPNKVLGNYIYKQIDDFDMTHPWARGVYDAAVREIAENMPTQVGSIEKYKKLLKGELPDGFLEKKKLNMNEIFSVKASAKNKAYPYAYFIDVIDRKLNQNELAKFHGHLSKAQTNLKNKIGQIRQTENPKFRKALYKEAEDIVKKFEGTRKRWRKTIKKNYPGKKFNLPNIVLGKEKEILAKDMKIAENIYKKADLDKWAAKGVDIAGHVKKTGYVMTGAADKTAMFAPDIEDFMKNRRILIEQGKANAALKTAKKGGFGEQVKKICRLAKSSGGRIGFALGPDSCPLIDSDPKRFLNEIVKIDKGVVGKFFKTPQAVKIAKGIARSALSVANPTTWIGGEAFYVGLEGMNSHSKGVPWLEAFDDAFIFYDFERVNKNIEDTASKMNLDENSMALLKNTMNINRFDSDMGKVQSQLEMVESDPLSEIDVSSSHKRIDEIQGQLDNEIQSYMSNIGKLFNQDPSTLSQENLYKGFDILSNVFRKKVLTERQDAYKDIATRADPLAGNLGNWLNTNLFNLDVWKPQHLLTTKLTPQQEKQKYLDEIGNEFIPGTKIPNPKYNPRELYLYNRDARNLTYDSPLVDEALALRTESQPVLGTGWYSNRPYASGGRAGYMGGGIAAIRKPSEIPPLRQGLRSIMINGKKS